MTTAALSISKKKSGGVTMETQAKKKKGSWMHRRSF